MYEFERKKPSLSIERKHQRERLPNTPFFRGIWIETSTRTQCCAFFHFTTFQPYVCTEKLIQNFNRTKNTQSHKVLLHRGYSYSVKSPSWLHICECIWKSGKYRVFFLFVFFTRLFFVRKSVVLLMVLVARANKHMQLNHKFHGMRFNARQRHTISICSMKAKK